MNDFNAGRDIKIGGDLSISNIGFEAKFKSLDQCDHIELEAEKEHAKNLQKDEQRRWLLFCLKPFLFSVIFGMLAWGWSQVGFWQKELITAFLTLISGAGVWMTYSSVNKQSRTELILRERLNNINDLLLFRKPRKLTKFFDHNHRQH